MIGALYLCLCFTVGWGICSIVFPNLEKLTQTAYDKRQVSISPYLLVFPAWYITGTLALTWCTYLVAILFDKTQRPLLAANWIVMPLAALFSIALFIVKYRRIKQNRPVLDLLSMIQRRLASYQCSDQWICRYEAGLVLVVIALASVLMWVTFFVRGNQLFVGATVFSDFAPHIGMIRSFSHGNNFPTCYSHFAGDGIRYHFMFQFLVGNLEFLGMRIDYAFNTPSVLSFICAFLLLYLLAVKITAKVGAGLLACAFFAFRSAKTLFAYLAGLPAGTSVLKALTDNTAFISETPHEDWGLWNLNVYCNQRHLAFGLATIFLVIFLCLPRLYEMFAALKDDKNSNRLHIQEKEKGSFVKNVMVLFFTKEGWAVQNLRLSIACGVLLGSLGFFHGAAVIGCLLVLFVVAVFSERRLEFVILAGITMAMCMLQSAFFTNGSVVSPHFLFGFIAENKTLFGVASYLDKLLGILPLVLLAAFCFAVWEERVLMIAFSLPLLFALTVSLTVDVTVNHKYIMMSCILLGVFAAEMVTRMLERRDIVVRITGVILVIVLTATGVYDFVTVLRKNIPDRAVVLKLNDPLTTWIDKNSDSKDVFLTSNYALNQVVLGGAMLYLGWSYFPWSAGYDTDYRSSQVTLMYEAKTPKELDALVTANHIRYIIVDQNNRTSADYTVNEKNISESYECVYRQGEGDQMTSVYNTRKRLSQ
jgi:hypothetical protein